MPNIIRAFIAIELGNSIRAELASIQAKLKTAGADIKWVAPENIHLTLKFLGNVEREKITAIKNALDTITPQTQPFSISLSEINAFPNLNSPRVVWVGVGQCMDGASRPSNQHANLTLLTSEIEEQLEKLGFPKEARPFFAHLTLGRARSPKGREKLKEIIEDINKCRGLINQTPARISHISLFQSTLTPAGPIYKDLYEAKLITV